MSLGRRIGAAWRALTGAPQEPARRYGGWDAAQTNRLFQDWFATSLPADEELRWSIRRMRDRARDLSRNNPIAKRYLGMLADNVIGPCGITLQAQVKNNDGKLSKPINDRIEAAWAEWSEAPTLDGNLSRVRLEQQLLKTMARDGEVFVRQWRGVAVNRFAFALEPIDADLLDEEYNRLPSEGRNEIRMGIELDNLGRRVAYHFWSEPPSGVMSGSRRRVRIPANEIRHLYDPERVHQHRGAPWMAPVMADIRTLDGYEEAALVAARIAAAQSFWFVAQGESATPPPANNQNQIAIDIQPGQMGFAPPGYKPEAVAGTFPNTEHGAFVKEIKRRIASGLEVSYNGLCNDLENINYSSYKGGLSAERDRYCSLQEMWISMFEEPIYRDWLGISLLSGALVLDSRAPEKFYNVRWYPRRWPSIEPLKEMTAHIDGIHEGLTSRTRVLAEQGLDFRDILEELANETKMASELGIEVDSTKRDQKMATKDEGDDPEKPEPGNNGYGGRISILSAGRRS